jgi:hypothetical protein
VPDEMTISVILSRAGEVQVGQVTIIIVAKEISSLGNEVDITVHGRAADPQMVK